MVPYTDFPERFQSTKRLLLRTSDLLLEKEVESAFLRNDRVIVKLAGIDTPEEAARFRGVLLQVPVEEVWPLPDDSFYHFQVVGLPVYTVDGKFVGEVTEVINTGSNDVYSVSDPDQRKEYLLPAIKEVILKIDLAEKRMIIKPLPGLLEV